MPVDLSANLRKDYLMEMERRVCGLTGLQLVIDRLLFDERSGCRFYYLG